MNIELTVPTNFMDEMIVMFDDEAVGADSDGCAWIGWKRFEGIGQFKYEWAFEYLTSLEITELIRALEFVLAHMPEPLPVDVCTCDDEEED